MRKGLLHQKKNRKRGYTLMEVLVVVGIIAILVAIAIPTIVSVRNSLAYKQSMDYAKAVFMAVQSNLTEMREQGELEALNTDIQKPEYHIQPAKIQDETGGFYENSNYVYVYSRDNVSIYDQLLPVGSIDSTIRDKRIVIELNPLLGTVYSVFYWEKTDNQDAYQYDELIKLRGNDDDTVKERKRLQLGYYSGSYTPYLESNVKLDSYDISAKVEYIDEEEGMLRVAVPTQYCEAGILYPISTDETDYFERMAVSMTVSGENGGNFTVSLKSSGDANRPYLKEGYEHSGIYYDSNNVALNAVYLYFPIDSLISGGSFANLSAGEGSALSAVKTEDELKILPGDNVSITVDVTFTPGAEDPVVRITSAAISGINPMFHSLTTNPDYTGEGSTEKKYILSISNGRHLQNLNALAPTMAQMVETVMFVDPAAEANGEGTSNGDSFEIDWNDVVRYYTDKATYLATLYATRAAGDPVSNLPYFVPIRNGALFGSAAFVSNDQGVVALSETSGAGTANIEGCGVVIKNLVIEAAQSAATTYDYYVNKRDEGYHQISNDFTGVFAYLNTAVDGINLVNTKVTGAGFTENNHPATGALAGVIGVKARISNCGVYIEDRTNYSNYFVTGSGAVGGLIGYSVSNRAYTSDYSNLTAVLSGDDIHNYISVSNCFAAVPVSGNLRLEGTGYGFTNGVGGLIGNAQMTNFYNCYASGTVSVNGTPNPDEITGAKLSDDTAVPYLGINLNGRNNWGAGGFVGTSHGACYTGCFATGDVLGGTYGRGGFVGIMCYDSLVASQHSVFISCYALGDASAEVEVEVQTEQGGTVREKRKLYESFSGGNAVLDPEKAQTSVDYANADYYLYSLLGSVAGALNDGNISADMLTGALTAVTMKHQHGFLFKDTYHLSHVTVGENEQLVERYSSFCSYPGTYESIKNLTENTRGESINILKQRVAVIDLSMPESVTTLSAGEKLALVDYLKHFVNGEAAELSVDALSAVGKLLKAFVGSLENIHVSNSWTEANTKTTWSYTGGADAVYPFPMIADMTFYGNWPAAASRPGVAYFEDYYAAKKQIGFGYGSEQPAVSSLQNSLISNNDGYAVLTKDRSAVTFTAYGKYNTTTSATVTPEMQTVLLGKGAYHVAKLERPDLEKIAAAYREETDQFYTKLDILAGNQSATYYFNPNTALSQVRTNTAPQQAPEQAIIRSARQLAGLAENMEGFWNLNYLQQAVIDFESYYEYQKVIMKDTELIVRPIGSATAPFTGTYQAPEDTQLPIYGHIAGVNEDGTSGLFGVLGSTAKVANLLLVPNGTARSVTTQANVAVEAGLLVGVNEGSITNVDILVNDGLSVSIGKQNADNKLGLLAGENNGQITDSDVLFVEDTEAGTDNNLVTDLTMDSNGGVVGMLVGHNTGALTDCNSAAAVVGVVSTETARKKSVSVNLYGTSAGGMIGTSAKQQGNLSPVLTDCSVAEMFVPEPVVGSVNFYYNVDLDLTFASVSGNAENKASGYYGGMIGSAKNTQIKIKEGSKDAEVNLGNVNAEGSVFGGVVGSSENCTLEHIRVAIGETGFVRNENDRLYVPEMVTVKAAVVAGIVAEAENLKLSDSSVDINGMLCGTRLAAGAIGELDWAEDDPASVRSTSKISNVVVTLDEKAQGYIATAAVAEGGYTGRVQDAQFRNVIQSDQDAAGFAGYANGVMTSCSVNGVGTIFGADRSTGFAAELKGAACFVDQCAVSPSRYDFRAETRKYENSYLVIGLKPDKSAVRDTYSLKTAGFVGDNETTIRNSRALGTLYGNISAGFVLSNAEKNGVITNSFVNVDNGYEELNNVTAKDNVHTIFAATNDGSVQNCYGWSTEGNLDRYLPVDETDTNHYVGCYFAVMAAKPDEQPVILYSRHGKVVETADSYLDLMDAAVYEYLGDGWFPAAGNGDKVATYSYNMEDSASYPYPMIPGFKYEDNSVKYSNHYGDWAEPVGVAYYEIYMIDNNVTAAVYTADFAMREGVIFEEAGTWDAGTKTLSGYVVYTRGAFDGKFSDNSITISKDPVYDAVYAAVLSALRVGADYKLYLIDGYSGVFEINSDTDIVVVDPGEAVPGNMTLNKNS